ncbi:thioredoxin-like protein [Rhizodiscina lignyota]|uniref:Thioredoxin-like protein n=1 Tax=Rhizodiscina lignyota TaxID=1504668 RepID=A0A9P4IAW0_9PEZI|nr:thioredoxin-like protein [Rhizodiscina lignyota]
MASIDPTVAAVIDRHPKAEDSDDEDALINALEDDDGALDAFREQRLQQLHAEFARAKELRSSDHGSYAEIKDEKQLMDITTSTKLCVVHFFKPDFGRCSIMDGHLETLTPKHFDTRFLKINVENAPFLVTKLKVQVLPCVIAFVDGVGVDRIIGFEGLSNRPDSFSTKDLESRLLSSGVLVRAKMAEHESVSNRTKRQQQQDEDDDDDDWD